MVRDWTKQEEAAFQEHEVNPATFINRDKTGFKSLDLSFLSAQEPNPTRSVSPLFMIVLGGMLISCSVQTLIQRSGLKRET